MIAQEDSILYYHDSARSFRLVARPTMLKRNKLAKTAQEAALDIFDKRNSVDTDIDLDNRIGMDVVLDKRSSADSDNRSDVDIDQLTYLN